MSCASLGDCVYLMRDSRRTPDGHPVRQSYRLLSHINRDKLDIFRIEKLWKNEKYVLRSCLFPQLCPSSAEPSMAEDLASQLNLSLSSLERNGLPLGTTTSAPTRPTTLRPAASITTSYSGCHSTRSFLWRLWWGPAVSWTFILTVKVGNLSC